MLRASFSALLFVGCLTTTLAFYNRQDDVEELTPNNFQEKVINSKDLWFIEFYAPWCGHCQALTPDWKKAATALKGAVRIGAVDADSHKSLGGQYGVKGFPTIKIFGNNKNSPEDYNGARSAQGIVDTAMQKLKSLVNERLTGKSGGGGGGGSGGGGKKGTGDEVIELTDGNFQSKVMDSDEPWLVEFFAPWCGHCKNLKPHWDNAAAELKGKFNLGTVDATVHQGLAQQYGVKGYPTIKYFPSGDKDSQAVLDYDGGRNTADIVGYALDHYMDNVEPPKVHQVRGYPTIKYFPAGAKSEPVDYDGGRTADDIVAWAGDKVSENIPAPEILELTSQSVLETACNDHQLCIISILPHILDCQSKCRNDYIKTLTALGDKYKKRVWGWVWAEAGSQPDVEESLGIGGFGYPAMAAVNSRKMKFSLMKGSFGETGINEFLRELAVGRGSTAPVKNAQLPTINNRDKWDGKDGEMPVEEDWDLSDVELDDLDAKVEL